MKLNLGSHTQEYKGFTNVDHGNMGNNIVDDAFTLSSISNNSVEEIIASHI
jgi:predicted SAM-dependent methyltransferase